MRSLTINFKAPIQKTERTLVRRSLKRNTAKEKAESVTDALISISRL